MTINLRLNDAAKHFGVSPATLRNWSKGRNATEHRAKTDPILEPDKHFFRRGGNPNAPYIYKVEACKITLGELGLLDPSTTE